MGRGPGASERRMIHLSEGMLLGVQGPGFRVLGSAGELVVSTYVINFPMLYQGACKERDVFYLVLVA